MFMTMLPPERRKKCWMFISLWIYEIIFTQWASLKHENAAKNVLHSLRFWQQNTTMYYVEFEFHKVWHCFKKTAHKFWRKEIEKNNEMNSFGKKKFLRINNRVEHIFWQMKTYCFLKLVKGLESWNNNTLSSGVHLRFFDLRTSSKKKGLKDAKTHISVLNEKSRVPRNEDISNIWPFLTSS